MPTPDISVLVTTYNRGCFLAECLDSLLAQTLPPSQIIVINDGSTDNTREVLQPYMARIKYLEKANGGKSSALNFGLPHVTGEYVWTLDDDDVAFPDALERLAGLLARNPELGFAYSSRCLADTRAEDKRIQPAHEVPLPEFHEEEFFPRLLEGNFVLCPLVRTSCYQQIGGFREDLIRSQDYEMAVRLARHFRAGRVSGPTYYLRRHDGLRGSAADRFSTKDTLRKWREYDKKIFRELRRELDISEYLPRGAEHSAPVNRRRAYLQRAMVMASKGLDEEMVEDLALALVGPSSDVPLSEPEQAMLWRVTGNTWRVDELFSRTDLLRKVRELCRTGVGREVQLELGRTLYWHMLNAWRRKNRRFAARVALAGCRLLGIRGAARLLLHRLRVWASSGRSPSDAHGESPPQDAGGI